MTILLHNIWPIRDVNDQKVHWGRWNGEAQPLDEWVRDRNIWRKWQEYRPGRNEFNRRYIFSLMDFYHEEGVWLFGGIFEVTARHERRYEVQLTERGAGFIGRLKIRSPYKDRATRTKFEKSYGNMEVSEILREPYTGRTFPGYEHVNLSFRELETLIRNDRPDWKSALGKVNGVYLITDKRTGKRYVGSACGEQGVWGRWGSYIHTGHGDAADLQDLVGRNGVNYARQHFVFALLEFLAFRIPNNIVLEREGYWKDVLMTREKKYGLNRN